jgi:hypothetical protein
MSPLIISYIWYSFERENIRAGVKSRIRSGIDRKELTMISLHTSILDSELHWVKPHEFRFRGEMFDVVETTVSNDTVHYLCYPDEKENILNKKITGMVNDAFGQHPANQEHQKQIRNFFNSNYLPVSQTVHQQMFSSIFPYWPFFGERMVGLEPEPLQPPPRKG